MKRIIKYGVMLLLLTVVVILPNVNTKASTIKRYTGELYVDDNIYEGTPLSEIKIKGEIYDNSSNLIIGIFKWDGSEEAHKTTYVSAGENSRGWYLRSYQTGSTRHFYGTIKFEVIPVPDLVVTETKPVQYAYGTQLSDIKPNCTFTTVARKVMDGTITWDSTETPYYGTNTYTYTFTPSDTRYSSVTGKSTVIIKKNFSKKQINIKHKKTKNSITITPIKGCEYSIGGYKWQKSNVFKGLNRGEKYKIYVRYKETKTTYAGGAKKKYIRTKR